MPCSENVVNPQIRRLRITSPRRFFLGRCSSYQCLVQMNRKDRSHDGMQGMPVLVVMGTRMSGA